MNRTHLPADVAAGFARLDAERAAAAARAERLDADGPPDVDWDAPGADERFAAGLDAWASSVGEAEDQVEHLDGVVADLLRPFVDAGCFWAQDPERPHHLCPACGRVVGESGAALGACPGRDDDDCQACHFATCDGSC